MTRTKFDEQLEELHISMIKMGSLCEEAISLSARSLEELDEKLETRVFSLETEIDQMEREIETKCMRLLLHQQPVARDLRAVSAALKMISDMERIGDQAADIVELVPYIAQSEWRGRIRITDMAKKTVSMVTESIEAFVKKDMQLAQNVIDKDDEVDDLFLKVKQELMDFVRSQNVDAEPALDLLMAAKYFERIGDHAVNVAEWVQYSITGIHKSSEHHLGK
ncbi:MAG: phosphate signaling complex protein PhoU [Lachnospiraceae bacterium]|nr:phosphate signaling complex protein PhoU [Robinsoniella sp.]MDY3765519.1 phosphate signaling complex protein PhoU [Lachnospiraceae bacterium]